MLPLVDLFAEQGHLPQPGLDRSQERRYDDTTSLRGADSADLTVGLGCGSPVKAQECPLTRRAVESAGAASDRKRAHRVAVTINEVPLENREDLVTVGGDDRDVNGEGDVIRRKCDLCGSARCVSQVGEFPGEAGRDDNVAGGRIYCLTSLGERTQPLETTKLLASRTTIRANRASG
jgi:hypothetical protein